MKTSKATPKTPYHKKPEHLSTIKWQQALRHEFAKDEKQQFKITRNEGEHSVFTDYTVENLITNGRYKVALRSYPLLGGGSYDAVSNFCSCIDFKTNALGTCKHIEAVLHTISKDVQLSPLLAEKYRPTNTTLYLRYGNKREVSIHIGANKRDEYEKFSQKYFDKQHRLLPESYEFIDKILEEGRSIEAGFCCYDDAFAFIMLALRHKKRSVLVDRISQDDTYFGKLLNVPLYDFQREGVLFAVRAGRCLIADEMGLGKTIQAIGACEILRQECQAKRTLIVCPTSLTHQWKTEIEKFTKYTATVVDGSVQNRKRLYQSSDPYLIASYHVIKSDLSTINKVGIDTIILDEAQRIKNWGTNIARDVKRLTSTYAIVLTGTPVENKLEELYSIISFIDPYALGPVYRFLETHRILDDSGKVVGYRELNTIQTLLTDICIRRRKKDVLKELPERTDRQLFVTMTDEQVRAHGEYAEAVSRLVSKWKRVGFLDANERQRLMIALNCMRMLADSTYIIDQKSRHDNKIAELLCIIDETLASGEEKIVVFSQWERMTRLVQVELERRGIGFVHLHGGVPSRKRAGLLTIFRTDPACRIFLSTDAGGVGLNLQSASIVINLDLPWNPAVLEQRIGRVYRHGQGRRVNVVNLISRGSIEERMLDVLKFKSSLFSGIFDGGSDEILLNESTFKRFMRDVELVAHTAQTVDPTRGETSEEDGQALVPGHMTATPPVLRAEQSSQTPFKKDARTAFSGADIQSTPTGIIVTAFKMLRALLKRWF